MPAESDGQRERIPRRAGRVSRAVQTLRAIPISLVLVLLAVGAMLPLAALYVCNEFAQQNPRPDQPEVELIAERAEARELLGRTRAETRMHMINAVAQRQLGDPAATVDVLVLSGGGDRGAFGSGFLVGWGEVKEPSMARPEFEVVTGVSTGSFIAPFAFLGTDADYRRIDQLYRELGTLAPRLRGALFFLPSQPSLAEMDGIESMVAQTFDLGFAKRIVDAASTGRRLLVQATELDDGALSVFDLSAVARVALKTGDATPMQDILLASAGLPGVFPAREFEGALYADGSLMGNIAYGGAIKRQDSFGGTYRAMYPDRPIPTLRFWVIINTYAHALPRTVQPTWISTLERGLEIAMRESTMMELRHLYAMAELCELRGDGRMEVRWVAIPQSWRSPVKGQFVQEGMNALADEGMRLGADPQSWKVLPP